MLSAAVIDANIALKWILEEADSDKARLLGHSAALFAPAFLRVECAHILQKAVHRERLSACQAQIAFRSLAAAPICYTDDADILDRAFLLAGQLHSALYDCLYLALAIDQAAPLVTADRRFVEAVTRHGTYATSVRLLDDVAV